MNYQTLLRLVTVIMVAILSLFNPFKTYAQINEVNARNLAKFVKVNKDSMERKDHIYSYHLFFPESGLRTKADFIGDSTLTSLTIFSYKAGVESTWNLNLFNQNSNTYRSLSVLAYSNDSIKQKEIRIFNGMIGLLKEIRSPETLGLQRHSRVLLLGQIDTLLGRANTEDKCYEIAQLPYWNEIGITASYQKVGNIWALKLQNLPLRNTDLRKIQELLEKRFPKN